VLAGQKIKIIIIIIIITIIIITVKKAIDNAYSATWRKRPEDDSVYEA